MTDAERLGIRIGIVDRCKTANDARYEMERCLYEGRIFRTGPQKNLKAAEVWEGLAEILQRKADKLASMEERRRIKEEMAI